MELANWQAGAVADLAEQERKAKICWSEESKIRELAATHYFVSVAIATMGVFGQEAQASSLELGCRIREEMEKLFPLHTVMDRGGYTEGMQP